MIVGKQVIKASDIVRDLRVNAFLNQEPLDFSVPARRKAAERLIDQMIIRNQITTGRYGLPPAGAADALLKQLQQDRFGNSQLRYQQALIAAKLTEPELQARLIWQLTVLRFIDQRFRPSVMVSDEEVRAYYDKHLAELRKAHPESADFESLQPQIRVSLEGERLNQNFLQWLEDARKRATIEYKQEAFQ